MGGAADEGHAPQLSHRTPLAHRRFREASPAAPLPPPSPPRPQLRRGLQVPGPLHGCGPLPRRGGRQGGRAEQQATTCSRPRPAGLRASAAALQQLAAPVRPHWPGARASGQDTRGGTRAAASAGVTGQPLVNTRGCQTPDRAAWRLATACPTPPVILEELVQADAHSSMGRLPVRRCRRNASSPPPCAWLPSTGAMQLLTAPPRCSA